MFFNGGMTMSNIERNKKLVAEYPFLLPRNVWTDRVEESYDYSYIRGVDELPIGWQWLFLQMCEDLKKQLIKDNYLDKFRFTEIKEKYNRMECYHNGCSIAVKNIIYKYAHMSRYVCTVCGAPATIESQSYTASFCDKCWVQFGHGEYGVTINFKPNYKIITYKNHQKHERLIFFKREWNRYIKTIQTQ
jgi:hypothetical protein